MVAPRRRTREAIDRPGEEEKWYRAWNAGSDSDEDSEEDIDWKGEYEQAFEQWEHMSKKYGLTVELRILVV